jgi:phenylpropionate dioxygenase-like ring-hydroxylating dioxygenase large terminal subunit
MAKRYEKPIPFGWYALAYSDELAGGAVRPLFYFGRELVLFRTEAGRAAVLDAYCPHLGAHLGHGGQVTGESISCPFHGWQFDAAGSCTAIPYADKLPARVSDGAALGAYPVVERNQMIWAWYHPQGSEPTFEVEKIPEFYSEDWTGLDTFEWTVDTIVQEAGENGADPAHFLTVHGNAVMPEGDVTMEGVRRISLFRNQVALIDDQGEQDTTGKHWETLLVESVNIGPGQTWQRLSRLYDIMMMGTVTPIDDQSLHLRFAFTMPREQTELNRLLAEASRDTIAEQVEQDINIWNHKAYVEHPILCDGDGPIARYRKWFSQFYA